MIVDELPRLAALAVGAGLFYWLYPATNFSHQIDHLLHRGGFRRPFTRAALVAAVVGVWIIGIPSESGGVTSDVRGLTAAAYCLGVFLLAMGASNWNRFTAAEKAEEVDPGEAVGGEVVVSGTVRPAEEALTTPVYGEEAVQYEASVSKPRRWTPLDDRKKKCDSWSEAVPFRVEGEEGDVRVEPDDAWVFSETVMDDEAARNLHATGFKWTDLVPGERPEDVSGDVLDRDSIPTDDGTPCERRSVGETTIATGDTVTVVGRASGGRDSDGYATTVIDDGRAFVVLPDRESDARERLKTRGRFAPVIGTALLALTALGAGFLFF